MISCVLFHFYFVFFFKQKTAYEMRISDWSSDVCSSDLMRVGVSENPSWTMIDGATASGVEVDLVEAFAGELGARIEWVHGTEAELLAALERFELDLVVAGLTQDTPRSEEHTSELQSLMRISYAVFCLKKKNTKMKS